MYTVNNNRKEWYQSINNRHVGYQSSNCMLAITISQSISVLAINKSKGMLAINIALHMLAGYQWIDRHIGYQSIKRQVGNQSTCWLTWLSINLSNGKLAISQSSNTCRNDDKYVAIPWDILYSPSTRTRRLGLRHTWIARPHTCNRRKQIFSNVQLINTVFRTWIRVF